MFNLRCERGWRLSPKMRLARFFGPSQFEDGSRKCELPPLPPSATIGIAAPASVNPLQPHLSSALPKQETSTFLCTGHFYFALTCDPPRRFRAPQRSFGLAAIAIGVP